MSVSSERSCFSPPASTNSDGSSYSGSAPIKLKRRWIEMSYIDDDLHLKKSHKPGSTLLQDSLQSNSISKHPKYVPIINSTAANITKKTPLAIYREFGDRAQKRPIRYSLPEDPRDWTKKDVLTWLRYMTTTYNLQVCPTKFDMNGKALCLMNMEMFVNRVPTGGKLMYRDFRLRLYPAVFFQEKPKPDYSKLTPLEMLALTTGKYF